LVIRLFPQGAKGDEQKGTDLFDSAFSADLENKSVPIFSHFLILYYSSRRHMPPALKALIEFIRAGNLRI